MKHGVLHALAMAAAMLTASMMHGQNYGWSQLTACPGWNNPTNFGAQFVNDTGGMVYSYSGQNGQVATSGGGWSSSGIAPNVMTSTTGISLSSQVYSGTALANVPSGASYGGSATLPDNNLQFSIMSTTTTPPGGVMNRDPNTNNQLPLVPTSFNTNDTTGQIVNTVLNHSIRVGDGMGDARGAALYYELYPTTDNAMLVLYYAIVVQAPGHGVPDDPAMIIRVMGRNTTNTAWVQKSDTLAYYITSTPYTMSGGSVHPGENGWAAYPPFNSSGAYYYYEGFFYKQWSKVVLNLSDCLYQPTRIEIQVRDCSYTAHAAYAYVAGECRPMTITSSGCPAGMSTSVTTLSAPRGMLNYEWGASHYGIANPVTSLNAGGENAYFTFRTVGEGTEAQGMADYNVQADDFRVLYRPNGGGSLVLLDDSVGNWQTFRCMMTSAIDPAKPFKTPLYVNVQNTKPTMAVDSAVSCDGTFTLWNRSYVPGDPTLVVDSTTTYTAYNNAVGGGEPYATYTGDSAVIELSNAEIQSVVVRTNTTDATCYSEALYLTTPRRSPKPGFTLSKRVLCDADVTTITDTTSGVKERKWTFLTEDNSGMRDTIVGIGTENRQLQRSFTHGVEPIELIVKNGQYHIDEGDTVWCEGTAWDTVAVFLHPELLVVGDTIVCDGSKTDATVHAVGVDDCTYEWSLSNGTINGGIGSGGHLEVVPYADTSTYYVRVTSPQGCVAWDSIHAYLVRPQIAISPADGRICPGQTAILTGSAADHYTWLASPADSTLTGQDSNSTIEVLPMVNTTYTLIGHGSNDCDARPLTRSVTIVPMPIGRVETDPAYVDTDDPTLTLTDRSTHGGWGSVWRFEDGETAEGRSVQHTFQEAVGNDSVYVLLTTHNELGCPTEYPFAVPVHLFTAWFPNTFTPGSDDANSRFRLHTINEYTDFNIYIYNRSGMLVYHSDEPTFEWDGTDLQGRSCPQGAYAYVCRFRKPGTTNIVSKHGAITLLR